MQTPRLELALVHYPVLNRRGETIGSALTNLDLHDIARAARTFGARRYRLVTPFAEQRALAAELLGHWLEGHGSRANPDRGEALSLVRICATLDEALAAMRAELEAEGCEAAVKVVATCARSGVADARRESLGYGELRRRLLEGLPCLLLFGTGWGLAPEVLKSVDAVLPPIRGKTDYNHLSVRSAVAIVLDRLLGPGYE